MSNRQTCLIDQNGITMHRIAPDNPVRRRLFSDDGVDEARVDNLANVLQESATRDKIEKMNKWNFDFENEVPLEGDYEWYRCDEGAENNWIGVKTDTKIDDEHSKEDEGLLLKMENEITPKTKEEELAPLIRKRRKQEASASTDKGVRRRISF